MRPNDESQKREARTDGGELGKTLAAARTAHGLTIEEIATELRMEPRLLHALEQGRFEDLGPPVFAKGYLKQYGNRLGLKYPDLLAEYYRLVEPKEVTLAPSRTIKLRDERQITVWIIAALALALLAVFLMVWLLGEPPVARRPAPALPASEPAASAVGDTDDTPLPDAPVEDPEPAPQPSEGEPPAATEPEALETESEDEETAVDAAAVPPDAAAPPAAPPEPAAAAPTGSGVTLEFAFLEDCWLEVTDARGARLFYGLGQAGAVRRMTGEPPIDISLGNASGVTLTVDGAPYAVPATGRRGNLARFVVAGPAD